MKSHQGFAPIAILLIVLLMGLIGGVSYYVGKSSNLSPKDSPANNYQPISQNRSNEGQSNGSTQNSAIVSTPIKQQAEMTHYVLG